MNQSLQVIFLGIPVIFLFVTESFPIPRVIEGKVQKVFDGDTILVNGEKIRLEGIDAPEIDQHAYSGEAIGLWSHKFLTKKILNKRVRVHYKIRGIYGRIIGRVYLNNEHINSIIMANGMAVTTKYTKSWAYRGHEYTAKLKRLGIFSVSGFDAPWFYRKKNRIAFKNVKRRRFGIK